MAELATDVSELTNWIGKAGKMGAEQHGKFRAEIAELGREGISDRAMKGVLMGILEHSAEGKVASPRDYVNAAKLLGADAASEEFKERISDLRAASTAEEFEGNGAAFVKFLASPEVANFVAQAKASDAQLSAEAIVKGILTDDVQYEAFKRFQAAGAPATADLAKESAGTGTAIVQSEQLNQLLPLTGTMEDERTVKNCSAICVAHSISPEDAKAIIAMRDDPEFGKKVSSVPLHGLLAMGAAGLGADQIAAVADAHKAMASLKGGICIADCVDPTGQSSEAVFDIENHPRALDASRYLEACGTFGLQSGNRTHIKALRDAAGEIMDRNEVTSMNAALKIMTDPQNVETFRREIWAAIDCVPV